MDRERVRPALFVSWPRRDLFWRLNLLQAGSGAGSSCSVPAPVLVPRPVILFVHLSICVSPAVSVCRNVYVGRQSFHDHFFSRHVVQVWHPYLQWQGRGEQGFFWEVHAHSELLKRGCVPQQQVHVCCKLQPTRGPDYFVSFDECSIVYSTGSSQPTSRNKVLVHNLESMNRYDCLR